MSGVHTRPYYHYVLPHVVDYVLAYPRSSFQPRSASPYSAAGSSKVASAGRMVTPGGFEPTEYGRERPGT